LRELFGNRQKFLLIFDKGGYKGENFEKLKRRKGIYYITPAKNTSNHIKQWDKIPEKRFNPWIHPSTGDLVFVASCKTKVTGCKTPLKTVVVYGKNGYKSFFHNTYLRPEEIINEYLSHWRHENAYRVLKNDLSLDFLPHRYRKLKDINKIRGKKRIFNETPILFIVWVKNVAYNLLKSLGEQIGGEYAKYYSSTIIRKLICRLALIELGGDEISVFIESRGKDDFLKNYVEKISRSNLKLPWLNDKALRLKLVDDINLYCSNNYFHINSSFNC
jgi:hypothetical protein